MQFKYIPLLLIATFATAKKKTTTVKKTTTKSAKPTTTSASFPQCTALGKSYTAPNGKVFEPIQCGYTRYASAAYGNGLGELLNQKSAKDCFNFCSTTTNCTYVDFELQSDGTWWCAALNNYPFSGLYGGLSKDGTAKWRDAPPYDGPPA